MASISDEKELILQLRSESTRQNAFSKIVNRYSEQLYWQIRRMVLSHDDANDILQNSFIKAWTNLDKFRGDAQISTWLHRITINETINFIAKNQNPAISIDTPEGAIANLLESDTLFNGDRADALFHEAIAKLPEKQRIVFTMRYFDETPYEEMSKILDTSVGALKASYHIAAKKIESYLNDSD